MAIIRKKKTLDGIDRDILRRLKETQRQLTSRQIAIDVGLSGASIMPRLNNLKNKGIIKDECNAFRNFERKFGNKSKKVRSCSRRVWKIDLK